MSDTLQNSPTDPHADAAPICATCEAEDTASANVAETDAASEQARFSDCENEVAAARGKLNGAEAGIAAQAQRSTFARQRPAEKPQNLKKQFEVAQYDTIWNRVRETATDAAVSLARRARMKLDTAVVNLQNSASRLRRLVAEKIIKNQNIAPAPSGPKRQEFTFVRSD
jgi:hypothetical protein